MAARPRPVELKRWKPVVHLLEKDQDGGRSAHGVRWGNVALTVAGVLSAVERATRLRFNRLIDTVAS